MQTFVNGKPLSVAIDAGDVISLAGKSIRTGEAEPFALEPVTKAFPVITTDHAPIHAEIAYTFEGIQAINGSSSWSIEMTTPADKYVHFKGLWVATSGGPVTVTLVQGATFTGGDAGVAYNCNHLSTNTSDITWKRGGSPSGGTTKRYLYIPSATQGAQRLGASGTGGPEELVLARSTTYALTFANAATSATTVNYGVFEYEEDGA